MHYKRMQKHGCLEPSGYSKNSSHIRIFRRDRRRWENIVFRTKGLVGWKCFDDFRKECGGERPPGDMGIYPIDASVPIGPGNWQWIKIKRGKDITHDRKTKAGRARYLEGLSKSKEMSTKDYHRSYNLKKAYGITLEEYLKLLEMQRGLCSCCGNQETATRHGKLKTLSVDHDHKSGRVRGLLCVMCNSMLGYSCDDPERLAAGIEYLRENGSLAQSVLERSRSYS